MHCTIQGRGQPLLFIHGWAMHGGVWDALAGELCGSFQTIAIDLRGHGKSRTAAGPYTWEACARDILGLLRDISARRVAAVGWSMGASILLKARALCPELFDRLVLISGNPSLVTRADYACGIPEVAVRRLYRQVERKYPEGLQNFYDFLLTEDERRLFGADPGYGCLTRQGDAPVKDAALATLACLMQEDLRGELSAVASPTLILHGDEDAVCNPGAAAFMNDSIPGSRLVMLEQTGHIPFLTRRKEVIEHLRLFLENPHDGNR